MKQDQLLFSSLFAVFFGFLIFILSIMNQGLRLIAIFTTYYVLFLLLGLVIMLTGFVFMLIWHVSNRQPFEDKENKRESFYGYLALGIFSLTMGFLYMFYFHDRNTTLYYVFIFVSIGGIALLVKGLKNFYINVIEKKI